MSNNTNKQNNMPSFQPMDWVTTSEHLGSRSNHNITPGNLLSLPAETVSSSLPQESSMSNNVITDTSDKNVNSLDALLNTGLLPGFDEEFLSLSLSRETSMSNKVTIDTSDNVLTPLSRESSMSNNATTDDDDLLGMGFEDNSQPLELQLQPSLPSLDSVADRSEDV
jgi:hypothetical protein